MRDPVLHRQNLTPHHRTGTTYKAYPTYDLACPIVDSLEGVTHALRTTEYKDRDEQYQWLLKAMGLRHVRIHSFSRVSFQYTVRSKCKLTWFVNQRLVSGWDDARMPTVRGVVRSGVQIPSPCTKSIRLSRSDSSSCQFGMEQLLGGEKKILDASAKRWMVIDAANHVPLTVTNGPTAESHSFLTTACHPKVPSMGYRVIRISKDVILENIDVDGCWRDHRVDAVGKKFQIGWMTSSWNVVLQCMLLAVGTNEILGDDLVMHPGNGNGTYYYDTLVNW